MIVIKIELWPASSPNPEANAHEIGRMHISNDGTCTDPSRGSYDVRVMRRGKRTQVQRTAHVRHFPRRSYNVWRLVLRALALAFPEDSTGRGLDPLPNLNADPGGELPTPAECEPFEE